MTDPESTADKNDTDAFENGTVVPASPPGPDDAQQSSADKSDTDAFENSK